MKFTVPNPSIEIEFSDEMVIGHKPAMLKISKDGEMLVEVQAHIVQEKGADDGWYNVVNFRRIT